MNKITKKFLESEIDKVEYLRPVGTLIICDITTKDGFTFTGESACVGPTNFNQEIGEKIAYDNAFEKMWMPYGFWLHKALEEHEQRINGEGKPNETLVMCGSNANKYRKKPVVVRAWEFDGTTDSLPQMNHTAHKLRYRGYDRVNDQHFPPTVVVRTLEGDMTAQVGDYIIKGVNGEFYPCKPDIFAKTYEKVEHEQVTRLHQKMHDEAKQEEKNNIEDVLPTTKCMDFGQALIKLKQGTKVARAGWNGKGMFLALVKGPDADYFVNSRIFGTGVDGNSEKQMPILDAIYMKTADNKLVPWLASQTDVLSEDWVIAD